MWMSQKAGFVKTRVCDEVAFDKIGIAELLNAKVQATSWAARGGSVFFFFYLFLFIIVGRL